MTPAASETARRALILAELARLGMNLARDLAMRMTAARTDEAAAEAAHAFEQASRSVRACLALEQRLIVCERPATPPAADVTVRRLNGGAASATPGAVPAEASNDGCETWPDGGGPGGPGDHVGAGPAGRRLPGGQPA